MDEYYPAKRDRCPTHPGEVLRDSVLPALKISVSQAARELGITRQTLHRIMRGAGPVTPEVALKLGRWCGNGPLLWLRLQEAYDMWTLEKQMAAELERVPTHQQETMQA